MAPFPDPIHLPSIANGDKIYPGLVPTNGIITTTHLGEQNSDGIIANHSGRRTLGAETTEIPFP